ncbi:hypothetical protein [Tropicibacter oceani]|uniref:Uncharacterized protein n=1 Tax=Tropicibacter oceani TaxID=3058420 RepID=A0ABY8QPQ5_9RHOB|nr:hypothetical protein [Tropicibacter oceani]WGW06001.1 hypothetical protein QF118_19540 [Tropicibacter oceani]
MSQFSSGSTGATGSVGDGAQTEAQIEAQIETDARIVSPRLTSMARTVALAGSSPIEVQAKFLKGLIDNPSEARKFMESPKGYSVEHGVLLSPELVKTATDALLFDVNVDASKLGKLGAAATRDILDLRINNSLAAVPAAVVAGAAVVAAAAAVVEAVVTVVRTSKVTDLLALKGLGPNGIRMPGGDFGGGFRY